MAAGSATSPVMVAFDSVDKFYGAHQSRVHALRNVSLQVAPGEFLAIVGPSGSGKSTCLNLMGCLDVPSNGTTWVAGVPTTHLSASARARLRRDTVGFVFQSFNLLDMASAQRNVELPLIYRGIGARDRVRLAQAALDHVGLGDRRAHRPFELSGGQQQRVAIARALVARPRLLIADEPTGSLDSTTGLAIIRLLQQLNQHLAITVVMVTHDPQVARQARRRIVFSDGCLVADESEGPVSDAA
ncbi:MAG: ABC transporter ATP-binding protein [Hyphomicrobiaceae bacterium]|nr:ABC transporter ATP-binding protein [Hyphomicrobiaceae bacterium]